MLTPVALRRRTAGSHGERFRFRRRIGSTALPVEKVCGPTFSDASPYTATGLGPGNAALPSGFAVPRRFGVRLATPLCSTGDSTGRQPSVQALEASPALSGVTACRSSAAILPEFEPAIMHRAGPRRLDLAKSGYTAWFSERGRRACSTERATPAGSRSRSRGFKKIAHHRTLIREGGPGSSRDTRASGVLHRGSQGVPHHGPAEP